jgi:hypothetical protein
MSAVGAWYSPEAWQQLAAIPEARIAKSYSDFVRTRMVESRTGAVAVLGRARSVSRPRSSNRTC